MATEIEKLVRLLNRTFDKGAWHGPSVKEVLNDVAPENAFNRINKTHSIIELVAHMTSWRRYATRRLLGDNEFTVDDQTNFPPATDWIRAVEELEQSQRELVRAVEQLPVEKLSELVPAASHKYTFYTLINGIIHHDLYHTGQIILINKATV